MLKTVSRFILCIGIVCLCACTNDRCTITGNISGLDGEGWVLLKDIWNGFNVIDSVRYENGRFGFEIDNMDLDTFVCLDYMPDEDPDDGQIKSFIDKMEAENLITKEGKTRSARYVKTGYFASLL